MKLLAQGLAVNADAHATRFLRLTNLLLSDVTFFRPRQVGTIDFEATSSEDIRQKIEAAKENFSKKYQDGI
jgi:hypothetical protein